MKLRDFLLNYNVDFSLNRINADEVKNYELLLNTKFGDQLKAYIIDYGYLGYKYVELYGVNAVQGESSDMVKMTFNLRNKDSRLNNLIVIENQGDGEYYFVDSKDQVYRYFQGSKDLSKLSEDMESYIIHRFMDV